MYKRILASKDAVLEPAQAKCLTWLLSVINPNEASLQAFLVDLTPGMFHPHFPRTASTTAPFL